MAIWLILWCHKFQQKFWVSELTISLNENKSLMNSEREKKKSNIMPSWYPFAILLPFDAYIHVHVGCRLINGNLVDSVMSQISTEVLGQWVDYQFEWELIPNEFGMEKKKSNIVPLWYPFAILLPFDAVSYSFESLHCYFTFRTKTPKYLFPRRIKPLLYHQIGNRNFFIFITNQ